MNLLVWSRPEGGNFPLLHEWHHTWARKFLGRGRGVLLQCTWTGDEWCSHSLWAGNTGRGSPWALVPAGDPGQPLQSSPGLWQNLESKQPWSLGLMCNPLLPGQLLRRIRSEKLPKYLTVGSPSQVLSCCNLSALVPVGKGWDIPAPLWILFTPAAECRAGYSSSRGISILPLQKELKHWSSRHILHVKFWYSSKC